MVPGRFVPSALWTLPFATLLVAVALLPIMAPRLWRSNLRKLVLSIGLGLPIVVLYSAFDPGALLRAGLDYVSFMIFLGSLYVISGGILVEGDLRATPAVNTTFLACGSLLASLVGTTGASMLLIRPLLRTNTERRRVRHTVIFFIFLVSNIGGCLSPLGDPPLLLGYLAGVPFTWTLRLAPAWFVSISALLGIYHLWDRREYSRESWEDLVRDETEVRPLRLAGTANVWLLMAAVASAALLPGPYREAVVLLMAAVSLRSTPPELHRANHFTFYPIAEVAAVFAGIFATMTPALDLLRAQGGSLGVRAPWQYFWTTGLVSSFMDNAPAYLVFLALAQGQGLAAEVAGVPERVLAAISLGSVFMGANTYVGNGPNFMVRSIAEERGVPMPGFGGYMLYSGAVLLPIFALISLVFFH